MGVGGARERERQTDRQTDRPTDRPTDRQTNRQTDRQTYLHAYNQWDQIRDVTSQKTWNSISTKETEIGDKYVLSKQMG